MKWKLEHGSVLPSRPRATWAQLIRAIGINDTTDLVLQHLDADSIPSIIDVPVQRIKLFDLGCLALFLGFHTVEIDAKSRTFQALSPYGSITTEDIQTFGKALRFEGDIHAIRSNTRGCPVKWIMGAVCLALGKIDVGCFNADCVCMSVAGSIPDMRGLKIEGRGLPLESLCRAVIENWSFMKFGTVARSYKGILSETLPSRESFIQEARIMRRVYEDTTQGAATDHVSVHVL